MKHRAKKFHHFGELIKNKRKLLNARGKPKRAGQNFTRVTCFSQQSFAEKLGYINGQFISNVERGVCGLPAKLIPKICEILKLRPEAVFEALLKDEYAYLSQEYEENKFKVFDDQEN